MPQGNRLARPQLQALPQEAGRAPENAERATTGELLPPCKRQRLIGCGKLLDLDDPMLR